jgi:hypothetical protein
MSSTDPRNDMSILLYCRVVLVYLSNYEYAFMTYIKQVLSSTLHMTADPLCPHARRDHANDICMQSSVNGSHHRAVYEQNLWQRFELCTLDCMHVACMVAHGWGHQGSARHGCVHLSLRMVRFQIDQDVLHSAQGALWFDSGHVEPLILRASTCHVETGIPACLRVGLPTSGGAS